MSTRLFKLKPGKLTEKQITTLLDKPHVITFDSAVWLPVKASVETVRHALEENKVVYGINTGFGLLANRKIPEKKLNDLQQHLLLSHAAGVGELLPDAIVQLILLLKINSLARGYSGVRPLIVEMLAHFYNHRIYPCIPAKGSVGASGDLAPLAHLSLPLIGEGITRCESNIMSGKEALARIGAESITFYPKEGLALLNGTQVSTAIALFYLLKTKKLLTAAIKIGALCFDAAMGCAIPFTAEIHELRGQPGQKKVAERLRQLLVNSQITQNKPSRVQDPYCLRCMPQVLGACWDNLAHINTILNIEVNAVTDNPLIFSDTQRILSGGNFHAAPVAQAADFMAIIVAEIGTLMERQIALLLDVHFNHGLPAFLADDPGLHSGFMLAHVTAAALTSANKSLAHPYSVDTIPTSANQEDHVSMATAAAWRLKDMVENTQYILAIALLAACRGIEFRRPLHSSNELEKIVAHVNEQIPKWEEERPLAPDIEKAALLVMKIGS